LGPKRPCGRHHSALTAAKKRFGFLARCGEVIGGALVHHDDGAARFELLACVAKDLDRTGEVVRALSTPANQRKLDVVEGLALLAEQSGMTMIDLALAWAINHPGVTSAIIGPRTMEQLDSQLPSAEVALNTEILDRIDELVAPGVTLNADDNSYGAAELTPEARRR
jgi:hypothetical protein